MQSDRLPVLSPDISETTAAPSVAPATPSTAVAPDEVVLLRANTNVWTSGEERTTTVPATIVLFRDGLLIADISPLGDRHHWRAIQLGPAELADALSTIAAANPVPFELTNTGICADCGVLVIQVRDRRGELVEMAVDGFLTGLPGLEDVVPTGTPQAMVLLSHMLDDLEALAARRVAVATTRPVPQVPASPHVGG